MRKIILDQRVGVARAGVYRVVIRVIDAETGEVLDSIETHKHYMPLSATAIESMREAVKHCRDKYGDDVQIAFATNVWECERSIAQRTQITSCEDAEWLDEVDYEPWLEIAV